MTKATNTTDERIAELHAQLATAVESLTTSDDWAQMLAMAARFHRYSFRNVLLIHAQMPEASRVAGYRTWQTMGRQVRKGEHGIAVLAPCGGPCTACNGTGHHATDTSLTCGRCYGRGRWASFKVEHVFDVSQTDGDELPDMVRPVLLAGEAPAGLWDALAAQVAGLGYTLERGDCGGANGRTLPDARTVCIRSDVDDAQACKTLAHELAHIALGHCDDGAEYVACRGRCEVEAESVAFIVCANAGLASDGYTVPYVATWAQGDAAAVTTTGGHVMAAAKAIIAALEEPAAVMADAA